MKADHGTPELAEREMIHRELVDQKSGYAQRSRVLSECPVERLYHYAIQSPDWRHEYLEAAERFRRIFEACPFSPRYSSINPDKIMVDDFRADDGFDPFQNAEEQRELADALRAVGKARESVAWYVIGAGEALEDWCLRVRSGGWRVTLWDAEHMLVEALESLAVHWGYLRCEK